MTHEGEVYENGYYIYGLIDPKALRETREQLLSIFYVGKGKDLRWAKHEENVRKMLRNEVLCLERHESKAQRIREILDRGEIVSAIRLSGGYRYENEAYRAESLTIDLISAHLKTAGRPPLTNATPGHHAGFINLGQHFTFAGNGSYDVSSAHEGHTALLVKGTSKPMSGGGHTVTIDSGPDVGLDRWSGRIKFLAEGNSDDAFTRRGWDPHDPWDDLEARERGRRYWRLGKDNVLGWLDEPETMPSVLLLGIPQGSETVVRYAWEINALDQWEYFPEYSRWGVPLGRRLYEHPTLGNALYEERHGKRVQILQGYAAGCRTLRL